jgi:hypothetical protein
MRTFAENKARTGQGVITVFIGNWRRSVWRDNLDGRRDDQDEEIGWSRSGEDGLWIDALQGVFSPLSRRVKQACL